MMQGNIKKPHIGTVVGLMCGGIFDYSICTLAGAENENIFI
jgi:hypothetical protein